ncbi:glycosyltransferase family 2 protein [Allohahella sp. A8]|uniref:glycosyltransferase family 2 protein n=1 Tax=Allohahella sp. A8 TaxID=3141461 RepID=UPI000C0AEF2E|nr:hypothetical protein [Hahellaceae bacterium]|tara:strand:+ start:21800 stop:22765 length:966 start_codon:yes stop_codon:yes gene_type:complete
MSDAYRTSTGAPLISVLMAAYNTEQYIADAIISILQQSYQNFELLIGDDGSTDGTYEVASKFDDPRVSVFRFKNSGKAQVLQWLIAEANGELMAIQDSDDTSDPQRLSEQAAMFACNPELGMAMTGNALIIDNQVVAPRGYDKCSERCRSDINAFRMPAHDPTMMFSRRVLSTAEFDPNLRVGIGLDFVFKVGERYDIITTSKPLYNYRIHSESLTKKRSDIKAQQLYKIHASARVRRNLPPQAQSDFDKQYLWQLRDKHNNLSGHLTDSAFLLVADGRRFASLRVALLSLRYAMRGVAYLKPVVYALLPLEISKNFRRTA